MKKWFLRSKISKWFFERYFEIPRNKEIFKIKESGIYYWGNKEKQIIKCQFGGKTISGVPIIKNLKSVFVLLLALNFPTLLLPFIFGTTDEYTSSDTWTCPAGVTSVDAECWAGGGGGAGKTFGQYKAGGGGGAGAYSKKNSISVTPSQNYSVVVGTGGSGGTPGNGSAGNDSYFVNNTTVLAKKGLGGILPTGGVGGAAASGVGDTKYSGGNGGNGGTSGTKGGGGGGGGAGDANDGGDGSNYSGSSGGAGGTGGITGGGDGGNGGSTAFPTGDPGSILGGAGGGSGSGSAALELDGGNGQRGKVVLTYTAAAGPTNLKTVNAVTKASVKTINGVAIGSVKSIDGIT